jgi:hypothetical protein
MAGFQDLKNIRGTWQLTSIVCLLFLGPLAICLCVAAVNGEFGSTQGPYIEDFCGGFALFFIILSALAIWTRLRAAKDSGARTLIIKRLIIGFVLLIVAVIATILSAVYGVIPVPYGSFFLVPTGLYIAGFVLICKGISPCEPYRQPIALGLRKPPSTPQRSRPYGR